MIEFILSCVAIFIIIKIFNKPLYPKRKKKKNNISESFEGLQSLENSDYRNIKFNEDYDSLAKNEQKLEKMEQEHNQYYEQKVKLYEHVKKADNYVEKGKNYELQIMKFYQSKNYRVFPNGINKGKKDAGIDLIAWKDDEVVLIQCKNHKKEIQQDQIRKFIGDCYLFENKYKEKIKHRKIKREFVSNSSADYGSKMFLNENQGIVNFLNIKANF